MSGSGHFLSFSCEIDFLEVMLSRVSWLIEMFGDVPFIMFWVSVVFCTHENLRGRAHVMTEHIFRSKRKVEAARKAHQKKRAAKAKSEAQDSDSIIVGKVEFIKFVNLKNNIHVTCRLI